MQISVTERGNFRRCKRLWNYTSFNRMSLTPVKNSPALNLGTLIHAALADWMQDADTDPQDAFVTHSADMIQKAEDAYLVTVGAAMSQSEKQPLYEVMNLGYNMVGNYVAFHGAPLPKNFRLIQPEQKCVIDIPGVADNWLCNNCKHRWWVQLPADIRDYSTKEYCPVCHAVTETKEKAQLEGTLDGFVVDNKDRLYVLERKTYGNRPRLDVLQQNDQFLAYVWILTQLFPSYKIGGLLYDGLWKRDNKPLEECFMRHLIDRPPHEVAEFQDNLRAEYIDMMNTTVCYPNRNWMGCVDCKAFERLCTVQSRGEDMQYMLEENYTFRERHEDDDTDD